VLRHACATGGISLALLAGGDVAAQGPGPFVGPVTNPFGLADVGSYTTPSAADLDGDGDLDVLAGEFLGDFLYFENTAGPGAPPDFIGPTPNPFGLAPAAGSYSAPSVADLDGDGDLDVLGGESDGGFAYYENTAGAGAPPTFAAAVTDPFGLADVGYRNAPSVADLDGDGDLDVLSGEHFGSFLYFENTAGAGATPAFVGPVTNPFGLADIGSYSAPSVADLDGDGDLDVLAAQGSYSYGGATFSYFENTAGPGAPPVFAAPVTNPFGLGDAGSYNVPSVADLDGDGDLDVLSGEQYGGFLYFENTEAVAVEPPAPDRLAAAVLGPVRPNPLDAGGATIPFELAGPAAVDLAVYDALGRRVAVLVAGPHGAGPHGARVGAGVLAPGAYVVRLVAGGLLLTRRLTVAR
jgi:uncharacterized protein (DUF2141 family)